MALCWWSLWQNIVVAGVVLVIGETFFGDGQEDLDLAGMTPEEFLSAFLVGGVLVAPWIETVLQAVPIGLARRAHAGFWWQVFWSTAAFAYGHYLGDGGSWVYAGLIGGFYSAFLYAELAERFEGSAAWYQRFAIPAFVCTALVHCAYNFATWLLLVVAFASE